MEGCGSSLRSSYVLTATVLTLLVFNLAVKSCSAAGTNHGKINVEFIKTSCQVTRYPHVCFDSLSVYASTIQTNPQKLAYKALSVSLKSVRSACAMITRLLKKHGIEPAEVGAMKDCVENMGDAIDQLKRSMEEMDHLGGHDFQFHMGNIQTWVSAALTNEDTCMDGLDDDAMNDSSKSAITSRITTVAQLTSNALALINDLSSTHSLSP